MNTIENNILSSICAIVAIKLSKSHVTIDEVEALYSSGTRPDINAEIDYILGDD